MIDMLPIWCSNPICPQFVHTGRRQYLGHVERGAMASPKCRKCSREIPQRPKDGDTPFGKEVA